MDLKENLLKMTVEISKKDSYIELFRENGFNCFPISANSKVADYRYKAKGKTVPNQTITKKENYGILPTKDGLNAIIDIDEKERYRKFAESMIKEGYMVIESPHGWHIPVINLGNYATKMELFDYNYQKEKIIEIQGWLHYCVGVGSQIIDEASGNILKYVNRGSEKIWSAKGKSFDEFVNAICKNCSVESIKKNSTSSYKYLRDQFIKNEIPKPKQSNDYFFEASRVCLTDGLTKEEALDKIRIVYDKWAESEQFSHRPWSNIESKVNEVYEKNMIIQVGKEKKDSRGNIDRTKVAEGLIELRKIYSNPTTHEVFENKNGFLEKINDTLKKELQHEYPEMEKSDYDQILFKMEGFAEDLPPTNKDLIVFKNGIYSKKAHTTIETDDLADMGFNDYNYLEKTEENEPKEFLKFFKSYNKEELPRFYAGLKAIFSGYHDSRITTLHGISRVGKTTIMSILCKVIGQEYAYSVDLEIFLEDRATMSEIIGKRLVVFQDLPEKWKDFTKIKNITGESQLNIRQFNKKSEMSDNKIKIFATANQLPEIKESVKNAMYSARLSLIHNIETVQFEEDVRLEDRIIESEAEKIISWIINLPDEDCKYENKETIEKEWEELASPQISWLDCEYTPTTDMMDKKTVVGICDEFRAFSKNSMKVSIDQMVISLKGLGYSVHDNVVKNIKLKAKPVGLKDSDNNS